MTWRHPRGATWWPDGRDQCPWAARRFPRPPAACLSIQGASLGEMVRYPTRWRLPPPACLLRLQVLLERFERLQPGCVSQDLTYFLLKVFQHHNTAKASLHCQGIRAVCRCRSPPMLHYMRGAERADVAVAGAS